MGHMDTVFPHEVSVPFTPLGDGRAKGSGLTDMKGGLVVMLYALRKALPAPGPEALPPLRGAR